MTLMKWWVEKSDCQNLREGLRKEWLETNGLGDYASSTVVNCHTRRYHGLLVANLSQPAGRHVLLSSYEETLCLGDHEFELSCHKYPGLFHPRGHEYLDGVESDGWPVFKYRIGDVVLTREILMPFGRHTTLVRYTIGKSTVPAMLRIKPLLAFRSHHDLTRANVDLQVKTYPAKSGFKIQPYNALPPIVIQANAPFDFFPSPAWYRNFEYFIEQERGFPFTEDLFQPGVFEIPLIPGQSLILAATLENGDDDLDLLWNDEVQRRKPVRRTAGQSIITHLESEGRRFLIHEPDGRPSVLAGYHWFDTWGRDALISLPGLTFCTGRPEEGAEILARIGETEKNGLLPNIMASHHSDHAYNSVDASLWYIWAVQQMREMTDGQSDMIRTTCLPVIRRIIQAFRHGTDHGIYMDSDGLLHAGSACTQLTWMDAKVDGVPVTPRHGCPVEINALWYNALAFLDQLGDEFHTPEDRCPELLDQLRRVFRERFWNEAEGCLGDVWRDGALDTSIRPNQIFAVSLPHSVLEPENRMAVVDTVRRHLLTPFGLRTLSPRNPQYAGTYDGSPSQRDSVYHQGTVWPWLLGAYGEAALRVTRNRELAAKSLLDTITPLFTRHLQEAGMGTLSEIFDGNPPHQPHGCIAQSWSVGEVIRLLHLLKKAAPQAFLAWETTILRRL
jgi:predicted glycogen debranching enzyme